MTTISRMLVLLAHGHQLRGQAGKQLTKTSIHLGQHETPGIVFGDVPAVGDLGQDG